MAHPNVQERMDLPAVGTTRAIDSVDANAWVALKAGAVFDLMDLALANVAAGYTSVNKSADQPMDASRFLTIYGLWPTFNATRALLAEMFGPGVSLTPSIRTDRESEKLELLFEIRSEPPRSYEDERAFLAQYLARVPRPANAPSPTLFWDAPVPVV